MLLVCFWRAWRVFGRAVRSARQCWQTCSTPQTKSHLPQNQPDENGRGGRPHGGREATFYRGRQEPQQGNRRDSMGGRSYFKSKINSFFAGSLVTVAVNSLP